MAAELPFEKPLLELQDKIKELRAFSEEQGIDLGTEIARLEERARTLSEEIYNSLTPWQKTQIARLPARPTTLDYIGMLLTDFVELHGDRAFGDDPSIVGGIGLFEGLPVTVIGHQKGKDTKDNISRNFGMSHPEGYRKALRLMRQADKFGRPVICFIDTPGAYPGMAAEERGQSEAIAHNLLEMAKLRVPLISIVTGEGGSGGALALGMGNRIYMLEHAVYSVISPEGAAALLWKDAGLAQKAAESMKITAQDIIRFGFLDGIIKEPFGGAHKNRAEQADAIRKTLAEALDELRPLSPEELVEERRRKFLQIGAMEGMVSGDIK
jgi:acetyl-CoA carboxylase carboxyl transferase subunit alpha